MTPPQKSRVQWESMLDNACHQHQFTMLKKSFPPPKAECNRNLCLIMLVINSPSHKNNPPKSRLRWQSMLDNSCHQFTKKKKTTKKQKTTPPKSRVQWESMLGIACHQHQFTKLKYPPSKAECIVNLFLIMLVINSPIQKNKNNPPKSRVQWESMLDNPCHQFTKPKKQKQPPQKAECNGNLCLIMLFINSPSKKKKTPKAECNGNLWSIMLVINHQAKKNKKTRTATHKSRVQWECILDNDCHRFEKLTPPQTECNGNLCLIMLVINSPSKKWKLIVMSWLSFDGCFILFYRSHSYRGAAVVPRWKSDLTDKMKRSFFQAAVTSILLYGCTTWTLTKRLEKKLDGNYTSILRAILNKSWRQHPTRHQLYGHLPPITKTIQVRRTRHAGHCWRSRDEFISDVLLWTPTHGRAKAGRPARTYIQQLWEDTGCCPEDLPRAMNDWEEWRERVRDIRATSAT